MTDTQTQEPTVEAPVNLANAVWEVEEPKPAIVETPAAEVKQDVPPVAPEPAKVEPAAPDYNTFIKTELGFDDVAQAKTEIERLKTAAQTKEEIKFANEQSKKLFDYLKEGKEDDVYNVLSTQRKIKAADSMKPEELIKLHLELSNPHYTSADVQDVFEEQYQLPRKPEQEVDEEDSDFAVRLQDYNSVVEKISRKVTRDSFNAKTELQKISADLVLPDIYKQQEPAATQPADDGAEAKIEELRKQYLASLETDYKNFDGFKATYKDEEVELPIAFQVTEEEKVAMRDEFKNFQVDEFITGRWFDKDNGAPKIKQIMEDVYLLRNAGQVFQKLTNEAGNKRLAEYIKSKSNISLQAQPQGTLKPEGTKTPQQQLGDQIWSSDF